MKAGLLPDGRVIVAGGLHDMSRGREEISSGDRQTWSVLRPLVAARTRHTLTVLPEGRALVTGGATGSEDQRRGLRARLTESMSPSGGVARSTELWDPRTGAWSAGGDMLEPRLDHTATALLDGRVLVAGGAHMVWATHPGVATSYANAFPRPVATAEIWNPHDRRWQAVSRLSAPRRRHTATLLRDGKVLITGGTGEYMARDSLDDHPPLATAELFDPATGRWSSIAPMGRPRFGHAATLLHDGRVLVIGPATSTEISGSRIGRLDGGPAPEPAPTPARGGHAVRWPRAGGGRPGGLQRKHRCQRGPRPGGHQMAGDAAVPAQTLPPRVGGASGRRGDGARQSATRRRAERARSLAGGDLVALKPGNRSITPGAGAQPVRRATGTGRRVAAV